MKAVKGYKRGQNGDMIKRQAKILAKKIDPDKMTNMFVGHEGQSMMSAKDLRRIIEGQLNSPGIRKNKSRVVIEPEQLDLAAKLQKNEILSNFDSQSSHEGELDKEFSHWDSELVYQNKKSKTEH